MKNQNALLKAALTLFLISFLLLPVFDYVAAQDYDFKDPEPIHMCRGKMWQSTYRFGLEGRHDGVNEPSYPGNRSGKNRFMNTRTWVYYMGCKNDYCLMQRQRRFGIDRTYLPYGEHEYYQNYNFKLDPNMPEEYKFGSAISPAEVPQDGGLANIRLDMKTEKYCWGLPEYDDFIISRTVITNIDEVALTDVRFGWYVNMTPTYGGLWSAGGARGFRDDTEYLWLDDLPIELDEGEGAYVFFDDREIRQATGKMTEYGIEPGVTYGDQADPGNIKIIGSIDAQLYSPQVVSYAIIDCTPLKDGTKKAMYNILSAQNDNLDWSYKGGGVPGEEFFRYDTGADFGLYEEHLGYIGAKGNEQIRKDWKELNANPDPSKPTDGSFWERVPFFFLTAGPWDLEVGESAEIWTLLIGGDADRNITMKGGKDAVEMLPDASVENFRENWDAAMRLYRAAKANGFTNWNAGITEYPPPPCGNWPEINLGDELIVETWSEVIDGEPKQGYLVKWIPVPDDYVDPIKGVNDLKEYIVYKSVIGLEGPWEEVTRVPKDQVVIEGDRAVIQLESPPNIPTRWAVTSIDDDGNESGMQGHSYHPVAASPPPIDDQSRIRVIPNPFRQISGLLDPGQEKRLTFVNIPANCTIRIYTMAGDLVKEIKHDGFGATSWGSSAGNNYMLTDFGHNVMPGIYIYHVESHVQGHEGETSIGKFAIIK